MATKAAQPQVKLRDLPMRGVVRVAILFIIVLGGMQDGFNLAWKLGQVLRGLSDESLLSTYTAERQVIAQNLIDFDREWSTQMATDPSKMDIPIEEFYVKTAEFPAGFMTQYEPSSIIGQATHQDMAKGFPIGKRCDGAIVVVRPDQYVAHVLPLEAHDELAAFFKGIFSGS